MKNPRQVIPKSILIGIGLVLGVYWTVNTVHHYALGMEGMRGTVTPAAEGGDDVFRVPLYPLLPSIYLVGVVGLLVARALFEWERSLVDLAFVASGLPVSSIWLSKRSKGAHGAAER